jgi:hypothetical protein
MRVVGKCTAPDDVQLSVTITGTLKQFRELASQIDAHQWPGFNVGMQIKHVIREAERQFYGPEPLEEV